MRKSLRNKYRIDPGILQTPSAKSALAIESEVFQTPSEKSDVPLHHQIAQTVFAQFPNGWVRVASARRGSPDPAETTDRRSPEHIHTVRP